MSSVYDTLVERGFIEQCTHEKELRELLEKEKVTFYIGFDATADSLTAGHFLTIMAMMHMQQAGHRPIALLGGGTTMIGDPSMRSDMRQMMSIEQIQHNADCFKEQLSHFISFDDDKAILDNNANWLLDLEQGLTFFEFNYMLMQSYDFLELNRRYGCCLQMGGNDQWSNILGGVDLIRRKEQKPAFGLTFKLLTTSDGKKMGKTQKGAVWLDPNRTSPYEFYQYWRNIEDVKVEECLGLLTFLPMDEVRRLGALEGAEINKAKEVLAYEITKIVHGEEEAKKAQDAAKALFVSGGVAGSVPTYTYPKDTLDTGVDIVSILVDTKLAPTRSEARRLVKQGGVTVNDVKVPSFDSVYGSKDFNESGAFMVKKGKKGFYQIKAE